MYHVLSWITNLFDYYSSESDTDSHRSLGLKRHMKDIQARGKFEIDNLIIIQFFNCEEFSFHS